MEITKIPLLVLKDSILFPGMIMPVFVSRNFSIASVNMAVSNDRRIMVLAQKSSENKEIATDTVYKIGTVANVLKMQTLYDGHIKLLIQGSEKMSVESVVYDAEAGCYFANIKELEEIKEEESSVSIEAMIKNIRTNLEKLANMGSKVFTRDIINILKNITEPSRLAELIISNVSAPVETSQAILEETSSLKKLEYVNDYIFRELSLMEVQTDIQTKAKEKLGQAQKEYFLRAQMKQIQQELGNDDPYAAEIEEYEKKLQEKELPDEVREAAEKQISRLRGMSPSQSESPVIKNYLDTLLELPWSEKSVDNRDINRAKKILEKDHYGLEDIKERILEFLAVRQIKDNSKTPILCFIGPPGVGKTSLGRSISRALDRKFLRQSFGGLHDEAEIRGHRRTYVGAMPGKILEGIKSVGVKNPVFMLDEIDKVGNDFKGDPSSALLEVLDPEQNYAFKDNYLGIPFDLSEVFFIATANWEETIPAPLKDRMEIIRLSGYTDLEKIAIAKKYLIPRQLENNGLKPNEIHFTNDAILFLIRRYTKESGVRNIERTIGSVCRKTVVRKVSNKKFSKKITPVVAQKLLKEPPFSDRQLDTTPEIGVVNGLAWTMFGGATLKIEVNSMPGKGNLILTGQLGDVMKESARIALSYIKSNIEKFSLPEDFDTDNIDIHIHVPAGAVPKDGPSAGVTITTALLSLFLKKLIDPFTAMTGEISLTGKVLPIGGLREKLLAAKRNGIKRVIIPEENKSLYESVPQEIKESIEIVFVEDYREIFKLLFI